MAKSSINTSTPSPSSAAQRSIPPAVAGNDDLLTEILVRVPAKPLTRFKSVSKHWLSLISNTQFSLHHARLRRRKPVSALFLRTLKPDPEFTFVPFGGDCLLGAPHFQFLAHPGTTILDSCNGLLCFSKLDEHTEDSIIRYYICNPTTKRFTRIPIMGLVYDGRIRRGQFRVQHKLCNSKVEPTRTWSELNITLLGLYVAFDPFVSSNYRVVCVWEWNAAVFNYEIRMAVYRSEVGLWGEVMGPLKVPYAVCFDNGVFWNGRVNWVSNSELVCFDVDGGQIQIVPLPLTSRVRNVGYFGESRGHLHLVVNDRHNDALFNVFEMERDYSGWVSLYCCDLNPLVVNSHETFLSYIHSSFSLIFLGRGEKEEESFILCRINGRLISYYLKNGTSKVLCDLPSYCHQSKVLPYEETLFEV